MLCICLVVLREGAPTYVQLLLIPPRIFEIVSLNFSPVLNPNNSTFATSVIGQDHHNVFH